MIFSSRIHAGSARVFGAFIMMMAVHSASAQSDRADALFITGRMDHLSAHDSDIRGNGGGGGLEWLHAMSERSSLNLGIASNSMADSRWTFGKAGSSLNLNRDTVVYGELNLGPGRESAHRFT